MIKQKSRGDKILKQLFIPQINLNKFPIILTLLGAFGECETHQKSGFFIEGGFETGLLESREEKRLKESVVRRPQFIRLAKMPQKAYFSNSTISKSTAPIWTEKNLQDSNNGFSTTNALKLSLDKNTHTLNIKNYLPYDLHNLNLVWDRGDGKKIVIAGLESLDAQSQVNLNTNVLEMLKGVNEPNLILEASSFSDENTQRVLQSLQDIKVNLEGSFDLTWVHQYLSRDGNITLEQAKYYADILYNFAYVLSSKEWADLVMSYPENFTDNGKVIDKDFLVNQYRRTEKLILFVLPASGGEAGLMGNCPVVIQGAPPCSMFGLMDKVIDPNIDPFLKGLNMSDKRSRTDFQTLVHEFGHVKGYDHDGNLTCADGSVKGTWCYGGDNHQYGTHDGKRYYKGMVGVTQSAWQTLGKEGKLPIDYKTIGNDFTPSASMNQSFINSLTNAVQNLGSSSGASSSVSTKNYRSSMVGFNFKMGYQEYFNDFLGISYYGIVKYNYSKINHVAKKVQQLGLGVGADLLIDFVNSYSQNNLLNSLGIFTGLRALYNRYSLIKQVKNTGNLNLVTGFNYRHKRSKYSIGVDLPLIQNKIKVAFDDVNYQGAMILKEGISHFNVFFNYGWVF
ncbi:outer membrane protein [Helicobacter cetorum]|uniref:outer membrane protein n=1 Tax=Helicobacter cetorum TaxID=138563 RepID=UPI001F3F7A13|nr:outer membrane protein [Helicobacter cetorum]